MLQEDRRLTIRHIAKAIDINSTTVSNYVGRFGDEKGIGTLAAKNVNGLVSVIPVVQETVRTSRFQHIVGHLPGLRPGADPLRPVYS